MKGHVIYLPRPCNTHVEEMAKFKIDFVEIPGVKHEDPAQGISQAFRNVIQSNINEPELLIFEDDVKFTSRYSRDNWDICVKQLPDDWDILLGGSYAYDAIGSPTRGLIKVGDFSSLHCILVRQKAYSVLLSHNEHCTNKHIDRYLGMLSQQGKLNVYLCDPMIAIQYPGYSHNRGKEVDYSYKLKGKNILID